MIPLSQRRYRGTTSGDTDQPQIIYSTDPRGYVELYDTGSPAELFTFTAPPETAWRLEAVLNWSTDADDDTLVPEFTIIHSYDGHGSADLYMPIRTRFGMGDAAPVDRDIYLYPNGYLTFAYPAGVTVLAHRQYPVTFTCEMWAPHLTSTATLTIRAKGTSSTDPIRVHKGRSYGLAYRLGALPTPV